MPVREIQMRSPAKLNLFLEVLGKRDDGFHELETLMVRTDLHDVIRFRQRATSEISLRLATDDGENGHSGVPPRSGSNDRSAQPDAGGEHHFPLDESNLILRAARRLQEHSGTDQGADIVIRKRIPMQAGLGGGSSNAATTLISLSRLWNLNPDADELDMIAAELGSDVNFLLSGCPAGLCAGRGERVTAIPMAGPLHAVVVVPSQGNSTANVFRRLPVNAHVRSAEPLLRALRDGNLRSTRAALFNRLQEMAVEMNPAMSEAIGMLQRESSGSVLMTGSGSACFCLAATARQAQRMTTRLGERLTQRPGFRVARLVPG